MRKGELSITSKNMLEAILLTILPSVQRVKIRGSTNRVICIQKTGIFRRRIKKNIQDILIDDIPGILSIHKYGNNSWVKYFWLKIEEIYINSFSSKSQKIEQLINFFYGELMKPIIRDTKKDICIIKMLPDVNYLTKPRRLMHLDLYKLRRRKECIKQNRIFEVGKNEVKVIHLNEKENKYKTSIGDIFLHSIRTPIKKKVEYCRKIAIAGAFLFSLSIGKMIYMASNVIENSSELPVFPLIELCRRSTKIWFKIVT